MKIITIIILSIVYSLVLGKINIYSAAVIHDFHYIALPFLIDPITHFLFYVNWLKDYNQITALMEWFIFWPIFWPIIVLILITIKNKIAPYIILILIYTFILGITTYRLIQEPEMFSKTIHSLAIFVEPIGIVVFILGQIGLFYVVRLKNKGRLH